jgi:hypothetical protein
MIKPFIERARNGENVFLSDVRDAFASAQTVIECKVKPVGLPDRHYSIALPCWEGEEEAEFIKEYFFAQIYNMISALGGEKITLYIPPDDNKAAELLSTLDDVFQVNVFRPQRSGYGKCLNVTDRVNSAMGVPPFRFEIVRGFLETPIITETDKQYDALNSFRKAAVNAKNYAAFGMDIGGTDIKMVVAKDGRIVALKEYDWFPSQFETIESMVSTILLLTRVMRMASSLPETDNANKIRTALLDKDASDTDMADILEIAETEFGTPDLFDAIGICFPDVVIENKIVGGETDKMRKIRENSSDFEKELSEIYNLESMLLKHCKSSGVVRIANDGSLAAYTAAVELAHSEHAYAIADGVFAHSLGTDFGTGWIDGAGEIPQIPLEIYNSIIDIGNYPARNHNVFDLRNNGNFNTGLSGALQKYAGQFGAYRLAMQIFEKDAPELYKQLFDMGFIEKRGDMISVVSSPEDMRKALLQHIIELADNGVAAAQRIFKEIGKYLAATWRETEYILSPDTKSRVLYGRFIKRRKCFDLMQEGAGEHLGLSFIAGDDSLAHTPLMQQLKANLKYTVAHFGQAVGAIHYAASAID